MKLHSDIKLFILEYIINFNLKWYLNIIKKYFQES